MRGKAFSNRRFTVSTKDHPRLCGEKDGAYIISDFLRGSPPPMRGKVHTVAKVVFVYGITPAYAGKSLYACNRQ